MAAKAKQTGKKQGRPLVQQPKPAKVPAGTPAAARYWYIATGLLTLIAFWTAFDNEFTNWDDAGYVSENMLIRNLSWEGISKIFALDTFVQGNYHPLTIFTYALEYHFFELDPWIYHTTNIVLHVVNALLVFRLVMLLTGKPVAAGITAILFGVHPMHVESVAWVSERKDVLYTCFYLLGLIAYTRYVKAAADKTKYYVLALVSFLLSLLSKGQAVSLPVVFLLVDYFTGRELKWRLLLEKIPFFLLSVAFGVLAVIAQKSSDAIQSNLIFSFGERLLFASYGMLMYLVKLVIPFKLSCFYPYPVKNNDALPSYFYLCPVLAGLLFYLVYRTLKHTKVVVFGFLFFLVTIALVLQVLAVGSTIMSDRYSYVPYIGIFFVIGYGISYVAEHRKSQLTTMATLAGIYTLAMVLITQRQCNIWQDSLSLWTNVIEKYPMVPVAHNNKGLVFKGEGKYDIALQHYNNALAADPAYQGSYENRGNIFFLTGKYDQAIADFNKALELKSNSEVAYNSRGAVYFNLGQYDKALADFNKAASIKEDYPEVYRNRGNVYSVLRQFDKALADYNKYLTYDQKLEMLYYWKGLAELNLSRYREAVSSITRAITMKPETGDFYLNRAKAFEGLGDLRSAVADLENAKARGTAVDEAYLAQLRLKL
jgi:protein O-mannosyl-transferase